MKITEISTTNFKSFSTITVNEFLPLNFIFGFNNSGKSNLLKLIETIFSRKSSPVSTTYETKEGGIETRTINQKGNFWEGIIENHNYIFRFGKTNADILFSVMVELSSIEIEKIAGYKELELAFPNHQNHSLIIKGKITSLGSIDAKQELESVSLNGTSIYDTSGATTTYTLDLLNIMNDSVLFIDYDRYLKTEIENKNINDLLPVDFRNWFFNFSLDAERNTELKDFLSEVKKFNITSTDKRFRENEKSNPFHKKFNYRFARSEQLVDVFFENEYGEMPLSSFGTGVQQIVYFIFKISHTKPKILLMEEIELNLSPKYQDILIEYFEKLITDGSFLNQAFITSHSPLHCYRSQDRSFRAFINKSGETTIEKFVLSTAENTKLKAAHAFLIKSVYK